MTSDGGLRECSSFFKELVDGDVNVRTYIVKLPTYMHIENTVLQTFFSFILQLYPIEADCLKSI